MCTCVSGIGESEMVLAALFQRAKDAAPCVIFLDELQVHIHTHTQIHIYNYTHLH